MNSEYSLDFENVKVFFAISEGVIETVVVELEAVDEQDAEKKSNDAIGQLNNFWRYVYGSFLVPEPLKIEYMEKPNGMRRISASFTLKCSIRGKVNVDDVRSLYRKCGENKKFRKLLKIFGDTQRSFGWEFLQLFKIIEFEKNAEQREELIAKETGVKSFRRKSAKDNFPRTELTWKRIDMAHNLCPNISQNDLQVVNKLAKKILDEQLN
jgi:hypothetical protein